jgi:sugar-phosphatase
LILSGVRACLFDNDGVLVDSKPSVIKAWNSWGEQMGLDFEYTKNFHGRRASEIVSEYVPEEQFDEAYDLINRLELDSAGETMAIPGALELTKAIPGELWNVCTSAGKALGTARLQAVGIAPPETIVAAEDVTNGKPDPEPYALGAARLGIDSAECLVLEDAISGIKSGQASGAGLVIGVGEEILEFTDSEMVISDLRGISYVDGQFQLNEEYRLR